MIKIFLIDKNGNEMSKKILNSMLACLSPFEINLLFPSGLGLFLVLARAQLAI